jgi:hypothetical protein
MRSHIHFLWSGDVNGYMDITASEVRMISVASWTGNETVATVNTRRTGETGWPTRSCGPCVSSRLARSLMYPLKVAIMQAIERENDCGITEIAWTYKI